MPYTYECLFVKEEDLIERRIGEDEDDEELVVKVYTHLFSILFNVVPLLLVNLRGLLPNLSWWWP